MTFLRTDELSVQSGAVKIIEIYFTYRLLQIKYNIRLFPYFRDLMDRNLTTGVLWIYMVD